MSGKTVAAAIVYGLAIILYLIFLAIYTLLMYEVQRIRFLRGLKRGLRGVPKELKSDIVNKARYYTSLKFFFRKGFSIVRKYTDFWPRSRGSLNG